MLAMLAVRHFGDSRLTGRCIIKSQKRDVADIPIVVCVGPEKFEQLRNFNEEFQ